MKANESITKATEDIQLLMSAKEIEHLKQIETLKKENQQNLEVHIKQHKGSFNKLKNVLFLIISKKHCVNKNIDSIRL